MMEKTYQSTVNETKRILFDSLKTEVDVYNVSAKLYIQGISRNQDKFVEMSNIPTLREAIIQKADFYTNNYGLTLVKEEVTNLCNENCKILNEVKSEKKDEEERQSMDESNKFKIKLNQWNTDFKRFKDLADRYNDVVGKLNNL